MSITPEKYRVMQGETTLCSFSLYQHKKVKGRDYYWIWPEQFVVPDMQRSQVIELPEGDVEVIPTGVHFYGSNMGDEGDFQLVFLAKK